MNLFSALLQPRSPSRIKPMPFTFDDGGRAAAGFTGRAGDCVCRSVAIATGLPYLEVYDQLNAMGKAEKLTKRQRTRSSARNGVHKKTLRQLMTELGWIWVPTMQVGQGCKVHLRHGELPRGRLVVNVSRHTTAVINRVIHDTHDPSRNGTRCVYGYFKRR